MRHNHYRARAYFTTSTYVYLLAGLSLVLTSCSAFQSLRKTDDHAYHLVIFSDIREDNTSIFELHIVASSDGRCWIIDQRDGALAYAYYARATQEEVSLIMQSPLLASDISSEYSGMPDTLQWSAFEVYNNNTMMRSVTFDGLFSRNGGIAHGEYTKRNEIFVCHWYSAIYRTYVIFSQSDRVATHEDLEALSNVLASLQHSKQSLSTMRLRALINGLVSSGTK